MHVLDGTSGSLKCEVLLWIVVLSDVLIYCVYTHLQSNTRIFLDSFELGLDLAVSGDTPTSPQVTLVLFNGLTWPRAEERCANS